MHIFNKQTKLYKYYLQNNITINIVNKITIKFVVYISKANILIAEIDIVSLLEIIHLVCGF